MPRRSTALAFSRAQTLRRALTPAERTLWQHLRAHRLKGVCFRRQHALGRYIVDFVAIAQRLIIEVDGDSHANQREYDAERTAWLEEQGYRVLRFTNQEVSKKMPQVLATIWRELQT